MKRFAKLCTATLLLLALVLALVACDTTVSVTYEKGNDAATGELVVVTAIVGDTITIAENPFTLDGYLFVGWTDGENNYAVGDKFVVPMHDVELTARWEKITTFSVSYQKGNDAATGEPVVTTATAGDTLTIAENTFSLEGHLFAGWTDGEKDYAVGEQLVMPEHNVVLTARWEKILTVAEALAACSDQSGWEADSRVYVRGTVKSIDNPSYGQMTLTDGTSTISVYGSYGADGEKRYSELDEKPYAGDEVLLYALLKNFNGSKEINSGWIVSFTRNQTEFDISDYTAKTIAQARQEDVGAKVILEGVVARITYAEGMVPSGFYLVDSTNSIYVYDSQITPQVSIGNKVKIAAERTNWILDNEQQNAARFNYTGCIQVASATLLENDKGNNNLDFGWVTESTVKAIMDTPASQNITTTIFKVNALVKEAVGNGFTNYYIDDLDETTGSYVYTQCSGGDLGWLKPFDGKICTVYLSAINAKSSASGCVWRFMPIAVSDDNFTFDAANAPQFALDYFVADKFIGTYNSDPKVELVTSVSSQLLGVENVAITYSSADESIAYFSVEEDKTFFHTGEYGTTTITATAKLGSTTATKTISITVVEPVKYDAVGVKDAIDAELDSTVTVVGIVGPSAVNKPAFYLIDDDGVIAVTTDSATLASLSIGDKVVLQGKRENYSADKGTVHTCLTNATVLVNYYGDHEYSKKSFITGTTLQDFANLDYNEDHTTEVRVVKATVAITSTKYYTNIKLQDGATSVSLYCSSANQYEFLKQFEEQEITVELIACNWNGKNYYTGCVLSATDSQGNVFYNTLNFGK